METHATKQVVLIFESSNLGLDVFIEYFASGKINQFDMVAGVEHDVSRLQVTVNDLILPQVFEGDNDLSCHVFGQHIVKAALPL